MAKKTVDVPVDHDQSLEAIAESVRGSFQTVEDMARSFIREAIHQGVFPPGQRLNLDNIAATLGVSRMPVRASLRQLEGEGLLRIHPYRGATVAVLQPGEIAEIYEMRVLLEGYLLERAIKNLDDETLEKLELIVGELGAAEALGPWLDKRQTFYQILYERADRPRALRQANNLRGSVGRYLLLQRVHEDREHDDFMVHLRARDAQAAKAWLTDHLNHVSSMLQAIVQDDGDQGDDEV